MLNTWYCNQSNFRPVPLERPVPGASPSSSSTVSNEEYKPQAFLFEHRQQRNNSNNLRLYSSLVLQGDLLTEALQDLIDKSEKCFSSYDSSSNNHNNYDSLPDSLTSNTSTQSWGHNGSKNDAPVVPSIQSAATTIEQGTLDEIPVSSEVGEEIPVAASLVSHVDFMFSSETAATATITKLASRKRGREVSEDEHEESSDDEDEEVSGQESLPFSSTKSEDGGASSSTCSASSASATPHDDQWSERFKELCEFKKQLGHTNVPHNYKGNPVLARWVKRQRHQYKQLRLGHMNVFLASSSLTFKNDSNEAQALPVTIKERIQALQNVGFVFDCQGTAWDEKLHELAEYSRKYLDCNVPSNWPANPALAVWVKCQRRQYKMMQEGRKSGMTPRRIQQLEALGFTWELRRYNKNISNNSSCSNKKAKTT